MQGMGSDQQAMAMSVSMKLMQAATSDCFSDCVTDYRSPALSAGEKSCIENCSARFFTAAELMTAV